MHYLTDSDYQQLKDYGYDITSLTDAKEALARSKRADELVERIKREFAGVPLGNGMSLRQGRARFSQGAQGRACPRQPAGTGEDAASGAVRSRSLPSGFRRLRYCRSN